MLGETHLDGQINLKQKKKKKMSKAKLPLRTKLKAIQLKEKKKMIRYPKQVVNQLDSVMWVVFKASHYLKNITSSQVVIKTLRTYYHKPQKKITLKKIIHLKRLCHPKIILLLDKIFRLTLHKVMNKLILKVKVAINIATQDFQVFSNRKV